MISCILLRRERESTDGRSERFAQTSDVYPLDNHPQMHYTKNATFNDCQRGAFHAIQERAKARNALVPWAALRPALKLVACATKVCGVQEGFDPLRRSPKWEKEEIKNGEVLD